MKLPIEDQLFALENLEADWDSYGAPAPTTQAIRLGLNGITLARRIGFLPDSVVADAEGGVAMRWDNEGTHGYISFSNDGSAVGAMYRDTENPYVDEIDVDEESLALAIHRMHEFFAP